MYKEQLFQPLFAYKNNIYKCTQISSPFAKQRRGYFIIYHNFNIQCLASYLDATLRLFIECRKN